nr:SRPBCC domain-containing protein [Paenibacillus psychroresistens]
MWKAVTEAEQLSKWYSPGSPWEIPLLQVGETAYFHHSPNSYHVGTEVVTMQATIEIVDAPNRFALRWELDSTDVVMITTFILVKENDGTRVTITETGYETREQAKPTEAGYAMSLENLQAHLEGKSLPH